jgi:hypothetical protein
MELKRIIKEEIDGFFDWIDEVPYDDDEIGRLWYKLGGVNKENSGLFLPMIVSQFNDVKLDGNKVMLEVGDWCDLLELFYGGDNSHYGYIDRGLYEAIFCKEDWWEMYYDIVDDWKDQVWDLVESDEELFKYIMKYVSENFINDEVTDLMGEEETRVLDVVYLDWLTVNKSEMGDLIAEDPTFEDLKHELRWAYESSYNAAASDNVYNAALNDVKGFLGTDENITYDKKMYDGSTKTLYVKRFDITDLFIDVVNTYFDDCYLGCQRYYKGDVESDVDEFLEYCSSDCDQFDYSDFLSILSRHLENSDGYLNPRFYEHPDDDDVAKYFSEDVYQRI